MIGSNFTQHRTACCGWCGDEASGDHGPCVVALRNLGLDYCAACGEDLGLHGEQHDECMVFLTGRADLLDPSPEDLARIRALLAGLARAIDDRECALPAPCCWCSDDPDEGDQGPCVVALRNAETVTRADQARWN